MAAIAGDPAAAFRVVKDMQAAGVVPKLRSFTPALAGFAEQGKVSRPPAAIVHGSHIEK